MCRFFSQTSSRQFSTLWDGVLLSPLHSSAMMAHRPKSQSGFIAILSEGTGAALNNGLSISQINPCYLS